MIRLISQRQKDVIEKINILAMFAFENAADKIGIFFDVDGTLSDSYQLGFDSTNEVLRRHNLPPITEVEYHEGTKFTTPMRLAWHVTADPNNSIGAQLGAEFDALYVKLVSTETAKLYDGIPDLLYSLNNTYGQNVQFAALSNACTDYVTAVLEINDLQQLFKVGIGADAVPAPKPAPDGLWQIAQQLQVSIARCVYIGDSPSDGAAAKAAGMHSIGVTWGSHAASKVQVAFAVTVSTVKELEEEILTFVRVCMISNN